MPARVPRPLVGITSDYLAPKSGAPYARVNAGYFDAVLTAGGLPILVPPLRKDNFAELDACSTCSPAWSWSAAWTSTPASGASRCTATVQPMPARREESDRYLLTKVVERKMPLLAIGVGMQLLNVHFGGTLFAHLPTDNPKAMPHFDPTGGPHRHMVLVEKNSYLEEMYGADELRVNSTHHQAVNQVGKRLRVGAKAPDGVIEAIETTDESWFCVGVQWHPECDTASALDRQIFDCLVQAAMKHAEPALASA